VDRQVPGAPKASDIVRIPPVMVEVPKKNKKIKTSHKMAQNRKCLKKGKQ
jgi:hypothetical protein